MKKKMKICLLVVGLILLIAIVIVIIFFIRNGHQDDNDIDEALDTKIPIRTNIDMDNYDNVKIEDNIKYNISEEVNKRHYLIDTNEKEDKDIYIDNISLSASGIEDKTYFKASITNKKQEYDLLIIYISFFDKEGRQIHASEYHIDNFKVNETREINIEDVIDYSNAYDIRLGYN